MFERNNITRQALSIFSALLLVLVPGGGLLIAQQPVQPPYTQPAPGPAGAPAPAPLLTPNQLDDLVAPVALYPDALLGEILAASTYPLEIVEAGQWLAQNPGLKGQQLVQAAQQQNWDPSVAALVVFPDVLNRLNSDIRWTTDLGNAFLAQQADVMNAVQRMRQRAEASGKLASNPEDTVTTQSQNGQNVIVIQPANPQVVYVPEYDPAYVWGPPEWGFYPPLYYPAFGWGFGFFPGIYLGGFFGGLGWGGWGWGLNWFNCSIGLNFGFFNHYGWGGYGGFGRGFGGGYGRFGAGYGGFNGGTWAHNPGHREGVPYGSQAVANRFGGSYGSRGNVGGRGAGFANANRGFGGQTANRAGSFGGRGNVGGNTARSFSSSSSEAQRGGWARAGASAGTANRYSGFAQANRGGQTLGGSSYRSTPSYSSRSYGSYGSYGGARNMQAYRSTPSYGGFSGARSVPSYHSSPSFGGSRGGSFGGGFHSSGGGFHGGGGGSHGGGGRR